MFKFFGKKLEDKTLAEVKLDQIRELLFPPCDEHIDRDGQKYHVDYSADMNLDAALVDLEEGHNDEATRNTIKKVSARIYAVRKILDSYAEITDAHYLIVDDMSEIEIEKIQASDREY
jgi:hypothetical protein